jgi:hypothetical protein
MGAADASIVLVNTTGVFTAPVNGVVYTGNADYQTAPALDGAKIVSVGSTGMVNVTNLASGTTYYFAVYNFNGSLAGVTNYNTTPVTGMQYTIAPLPDPATNMTFSNTGMLYMTVGWTRPTNANKVILLGNTTGIFPTMVNGVEYTAFNENWTLAPALDGAKVLYIGGAPDQAMLTGLTQNTTYYFAVYTFNGTGLSTNYNPTALTGNHSTASPAPEPTGQDRVISFRNVDVLGGTMDLTWLLPTPIIGAGSHRILTMKVGTTFTAAENPLDGSTYAVGDAIGSSTVKYNSTEVGTIATPVHITGLTSGNIYWFRVFAYNTNGTGTENYLTATAIFNPRSETFGRGIVEQEPEAIPGLDASTGFQINSLGPNPATSHINVSINADAASQFAFEIYTVDGQQVLSTTQSMSQGSQEVTLPLNNLAAGSYMLKISNGNTFAVQSFIVIP